jgi:hypothetical protein
VAQPVHAFGDPYAGEQWPLTRLRADQVREEQPAAGTPVVAVVDTGVDGTHPDLDDVLVQGTDITTHTSPTVPTDEHGHGTHVAGIIAAEVDNGVGVEGLLSRVRVMPVRVLGADGTGSSDVVAEGVMWAVDHGADVVNLSLGGGGADPVLQAAVEYAEAHGVTVVAAMGNEYETGNVTSYPAAYPSVLAVGATDEVDARAPFSQTGPHIDVVAPGVNVLSTYLDSGYAWMSGTSMATPYASAAVAAVHARYPDLTPARLRQQLERTSEDLGTPGFDTSFGYGLVDPAAALSTPPAATPPLPAPSAPQGVAVARGDRSATVSWSAAAGNGSAVTGYQVTVAGGGLPDRTADVPGTQLRATVTGLVNGLRYRVSVRAGSAAGYSPESATRAVVPATVPGRPVLGSVTAGDRAATVSWAAPASAGGTPLTGYTVTLSRPGSSPRQYAATAAARGLRVSGLTNGTTYTVAVRARNAVGSSVASTTARVVPRTVPGRPRAVAVSSGSSRDRSVGVTVRWRPPSTTGGAHITRYVVRVRAVAGGRDVVKKVSGSRTSVTYVSLRRGVAYRATVQARNAAGSGSVSARTVAARAR